MIKIFFTNCLSHVSTCCHRFHAFFIRALCTQTQLTCENLFSQGTRTPFQSSSITVHHSLLRAHGSATRRGVCHHRPRDHTWRFVPQFLTKETSTVTNTRTTDRPAPSFCWLCCIHNVFVFTKYVVRGDESLKVMEKT